MGEWTGGPAQASLNRLRQVGEMFPKIIPLNPSVRNRELLDRCAGRETRGIGLKNEKSAARILKTRCRVKTLFMNTLGVQRVGNLSDFSEDAPESLEVPSQLQNRER